MNLWQRLISWYRWVMPIPGLTIGVLTLYFVFDGLILVFDAHVRRWNGILPEQNPPAVMLTCGLALAFGVFRVAFFHPVWRPEYRKWLENSPWTCRDPLPVGPVLPRPQDALILAALTLMSLRMPNVSWGTVPALYAVSWLIVSTATFAISGPRPVAYVLCAGFAGILRVVRDDPEIAGGLVVAMYLLGVVGHAFSLRRFRTWDLSWGESWGFDAFLSSNFESVQDLARNKLHGWPFDQLAPTLERRRILLSVRQGFWLALLAGWWFDSVMAFSEPGPWQAMTASVWSYIIGINLAAIRVSIYVSGHVPPISVLGRLATGRWILPRYDQVFVPSICILAIMDVGPRLLREWNVAVVHGISAVIGLMVFIAVTMRPDLAEFQLTGSHRIEPTWTHKSNNEILR